MQNDIDSTLIKFILKYTEIIQKNMYLKISKAKPESLSERFIKS